jgi:hypothetical protein
MARKEKQYHFIYKTTNIVTSKYYYGMHSTDNLNDNYLGSGKRLKYSINKYGKENHKREIIEFFPNRSLLKKRENELINLNEIAKENCMNLKIGGEGGFFSIESVKKGGYVRSIKYKDKLREWGIKGGNNNIKKHGSPFKKYRYDWTNMKHSEKTKKLMSEKKKGISIGENNSQYNTMWITNGINNKKINKNKIIPNGWYKGRIIK